MTSKFEFRQKMLKRIDRQVESCADGARSKAGKSIKGFPTVTQEQKRRVAEAARDPARTKGMKFPVLRIA